MKSLSRLLLTFVLVLPTIAIAYPFSFDEEDDQPYLTKEFELNGPGSLDVQTSGGSISVTAHEGNQVKVEMYLRKGSRNLEPGDAEAQELLENYRLDISQSGNRISAIAEKKNQGQNWFNGKNNNTSVGFTVYVPKEMETSLRTSGGSINLDGVRGKQELNTSGGSLRLVNIEGPTKARTSGGSIHIEEYAGILDAHTSGGSIHLEDSKGELTVHTSGGSIHIDNVEGSIDASTSGGGINANLVAITNHVKLHTSGGSITAVVPDGLGLDLDLKGNRVNTKLQNFNGEAEKDRIRGSMNGGGIPVVMSTSGGNVTLKYK